MTDRDLTTVVTGAPFLIVTSNHDYFFIFSAADSLEDRQQIRDRYPFKEESVGGQEGVRVGRGGKTQGAREKITLKSFQRFKRRFKINEFEKQVLSEFGTAAAKRSIIVDYFPQETSLCRTLRQYER